MPSVIPAVRPAPSFLSALPYNVPGPHSLSGTPSYIFVAPTSCPEHSRVPPSQAKLHCHSDFTFPGRRILLLQALSLGFPKTLHCSPGKPDFACLPIAFPCWTMSGCLDEGFSLGLKGQQILKQRRFLPPLTQVLSASLPFGILSCWAHSWSLRKMESSFMT